MKLHRLLPLALSACAFGSPAGSGDAAVAGSPDAPGSITPDGPAGSPDAMRPDAAAPDAAEPDAAPAAPPVALLLSEVSLAPTGGEFVEIANPTADPVDLSHYYLSDNGNYFRVPAGTSAVGSSDFVVRFPAGATIAAHSLKVVAIDTATTFHTTTGGTADYAIGDGTMVTVDGSAGTLTNGGELIALFYWNGTSDLVTDIDLLVAGAPSSGNGLVAKGGVAIDGPDGNSTTTAYPSEADSIAAQPSAPGSALSTKRIALPAGHETGSDQTSENTAVTWDVSPFTAPTPGTTSLSL